MSGAEGPAASRDSAWTPQVWIDAQLPPALARWLREEHGVDAVHVEELGLLRARDEEIFDRALSEGRSILLVTKDDDFPRLLAKHGSPPQVVWVRYGNVKKAELRSLMLRTWPDAHALLAAGEALVEIRRLQGAAT